MFQNGKYALVLSSFPIQISAPFSFNFVVVVVIVVVISVVFVVSIFVVVFIIDIFGDGSGNKAVIVVSRCAPARWDVSTEK